MKLANNFFYLSLFLLPSASVIAAVFLLIASFFSMGTRYKSFFQNKINYFFIISVSMMLISCFRALKGIDQNPLLQEVWDPYLSLIGLFNWLPFILIFWSYETFLDSSNKRSLAINFLIAGTVPVLFSGLIEYFFNFNNDLSTLYGFITWHLGPSKTQMISGLFNNPNYLSAWLSMILPLGIYSLEKSKKKFDFFFLVIFNLITLALILLTGSRNGLIAMLVLTLFIIKNKKKYLILFLTFLVSYLSIKYLINFEINVFDNFSNTSRFLIFKESIKLISEKPFFGFGAASFSHVIPIPTSLGPYEDNIQHTHNLVLELAFNYGLLASLFLNIPIFYLLSRGLYINLAKKINLVDQSWFISFFIISLSYSTDITYYDGRISVLSWILLVGLNTIIKETNIKKQINQKL